MQEDSPLLSTKSKTLSLLQVNKIRERFMFMALFGFTRSYFTVSRIAVRLICRLRLHVIPRGGIH